jgi:hypothetical protein
LTLLEDSEAILNLNCEQKYASSVNKAKSDGREINLADFCIDFDGLFCTSEQKSSKPDFDIKNFVLRR